MGWMTICTQVSAQAELHIAFASKLRDNLCESLENNTIQLEDQLKQVCKNNVICYLLLLLLLLDDKVYLISYMKTIKDGDRLLMDQEQWVSNLKKVYIFYIFIP